MAVKRVVIIGATSGIGLEVAKGYLKAGWQVGIAGRREEELEKLRRTAPPDRCVPKSWTSLTKMHPIC